MLVLRDDFTSFQGQSVLTIGKFDGLHVGHQTLLDMVRQRATARAAVPLVVTFDPHPAAVLNPQGPPPLLTPLPEKLALLETLGIEAVALITFSRETAAINAQEFIAWLFRDLRPREIWVGSNFAFGHKRQGNVEFLRTWGHERGLTVGSVAPVMIGEHWVSGTMVRQLLAEGDVMAVAQYLGRRYSLGGTVVMGDQRGRTLGFPTANIVPTPEKALPAHGVYITFAEVDGVRHPAVTNIGVRPTVDGARRLVETYLLDWEGTLYNQTITLFFAQRLRAEQKFSGLEALTAQIHQDVQTARAWFEQDPSDNIPNS